MVNAEREGLMLSAGKNVMRINAVREDKVKIKNQEVEDIEEFVYHTWDTFNCLRKVL